eukprot:TRINITY_DN33422_c0_g2_i1.p1 TRINITY_DN33422_c0_g2~~TRINITY_DN33422_c0_g2_i1.p1  ORF type:complete len:389 (+),score=64.81 TRINITY_DN33422_c0_g2_i1:1-1167(+)
MFMHCDAAFDGAEQECWRLAEKALVPSGLLVRLNNLGAQTVPDEMLQRGPEQLRKYWQQQQQHSEEPFSAGAWVSLEDGELEAIHDILLGEAPDEKALRQLETGERFHQSEELRAEKIGLEIWRVMSVDPVKSRVRPSADAALFGQFSRGEKLIAAERNGDWIRIASTADLWGVDYTSEAKASMSLATPCHGTPDVKDQRPVDDSSIWVPIDGSCFGTDSGMGRLLEQIFVPPGREPWQAGGFGKLTADERDSLSVRHGSVAFRAKKSRLQPDWSTPLLHCPCVIDSPGSVRQRQRERLRCRSIVHELSSSGSRRLQLAKLSAEDRRTLRNWLSKEHRRWQALVAELATLQGWSRRERLARLSVEDRAGFQQWLAEQKRQKQPNCGCK